MAWDKNWITFENVRYIKTSASGKAILVEMFGEDLWLPRSQMEDGGSDGEIEEIEQSGRLAISEWIANEKDLVTKQEDFEKAKKESEEADANSRVPADDNIDAVFGPRPPDPGTCEPWASGEYVSADSEMDEVFGPEEKTKGKTETETEAGSEDEDEVESAWGTSMKLSKEVRKEKETGKVKAKAEVKSKNKTVSLWGEVEEKKE